MGTDATTGVARVGLNVLAVEDELGTIAGPLDSLSFDGHTVNAFTSIDGAIAFLRREPINFLILDQHVKGPDERIDYQAGSTLAKRLASGELGDVNCMVPFVFVTGSDDWVEESEMLRLPGFRGIVVKASDVTTRLRAHCAQLLRRTDPDAYLDRVLVRVSRVSDDGFDVVIPSWSLEEEVHVDMASLPGDLDLELQAGMRFFARMNLAAASAESIELRRWEIAKASEEDDGLA